LFHIDRNGLAEAGFTKGRNVTIEYPDGQYGRLPALASALSGPR
jgi:hypothetical protein